MGVPSKEEQDIRSKATDMLLRDHVASAKLGRVVEMLGSSREKKSVTLTTSPKHLEMVREFHRELERGKSAARGCG